MTKKMFFVALASLALATSCSNDDRQLAGGESDKRIKFNTSFSLPIESRAAETTTANLASFYVSSFQDDADGNYMTGINYTKSGDVWTTAQGNFFWPVTGDLNFFCYAPENPGQSGTFSINKDNQEFADFVPNATAGTQADFIYAVAKGNAKDNGSTGVDITFNHALTEITVAAKNDNAAYTVEVSGVKISNVANKGSFTFPSLSGDAAKWTLSGDAADVASYESTLATAVELGSDVSTISSEAFMILPQQLEKDEVFSKKSNISVKVKITMQGGQVIYNDWAYVGIDDNLEMGTHYVYTLDFSTGAGQDETGAQVITGKEIELNVTVTPWDAKDKNPDTSGEVPPHAYKANSLMINTDKVYGIDLKDRINTFWASADGDASNMLTADTEWVAEVIWQDINKRAINFCKEDGTIVAGDTYEGMGLTNLYIKAAAGDVKGNVVVGVKKKGETDYLWSWHLWLTDYNPSYTEPWQDGKYDYAVAGGSVQHYTGTIWESDYKDKYIMDRNLGANSADPTSSTIDDRRGLYYQFGRKDPFTADIEHYDINGNKISEANNAVSVTKGQASFATAVKNPKMFYAYAPDWTNRDWASPNNYASKDWNDNTGNMNKSFFDPCPEGWRLPVNGTWDKLKPTGAPTDEPTNAIWDAQNKVVKFFLNGQDDTDGITYYPLTGNRHESDGTMNMQTEDIGYEAIVHSCTSKSAKVSSYVFGARYGSGNVPKLNISGSKSSAHAVRCVQE